MRFELLTLTGAKFKGEAREVALATTVGQVAILPHHEAFRAIAAAGPVAVTTEGGEAEWFAIFGGILEVEEGMVRLLADEAEHADGLMDEQILAALREAEEMRARAKSEPELARAQGMIDREGVRLEVARLRRRHRG
jgi:F-type H+-transporting ATPase subunit epsilon